MSDTSTGYDPDDEIYHQVMGVLAPAMVYFAQRPGCADANEAHARANVVMAWLKVDAWAEAHGPIVEEAEPEEEPTKQPILLRVDQLQPDDEIASTFLNAAITVVDVTIRPDDQIEIRGFYSLGEGERCQDTWTCNRDRMVRVLR